MNIYKRLGFTENPFAYTNADDEEKLKEYFVPPPYFDAIIGDYNSPSSSIVLAPRGSGKTAQRKMIENWCKDKPVLAVTYDRFEFGSTQKLTDISLAYHLKNIITKTLLNIIIWAAEYPDTLKNLSQEDKRVLSILCHNYLGGLTGGDLDSIIHSLKSIPEKLKEKWNKKVGIFDSVVKFILQANNLPIIDLPELKQEEKKLAESYKFQMEILYRIATSLRFKAIYILIDKVDETEHTANNAEATYDLIAPLLKDLDTHSIKGYAFKYFLWDKIHSFYLKGGRPDRVAQYSLVWSRNNLLSMLKERLKAFSSKKIESFQTLMENNNSVKSDDIITVLANQSPRNVIRFCDKIISEETLLRTDSTKISNKALELASIKYSEILAIEIYGNDSIKELKKLDCEIFTINYLAANIYKISQNSVRPRVGSWVTKGICYNVGTEVSKKIQRPTGVYYVFDPRLNQIINSKQSVFDFFKNKWFTCPHCDADILVNIEYINKLNSFECFKCNKSIS